MPATPQLLGRIRSVQAGRAQRHGTRGADDPLQRPWRSAFFKNPLPGEVTITPQGVEGDEQADRKHHGGPDQALLMYSGDHFPLWESQHRLEGLSGGGFGENLTIDGSTEADICLGDALRFGSVVARVSQPRYPCANINRRWGRRGIAEAVGETGRSGWYLSVVEPGKVSAGDELLLVERPWPGLTVALANDALFGRLDDREALERLIAYPGWRESFRTSVAKHLASLG